MIPKEFFHKKKAMTSEKASFVKKEGHRVEQKYNNIVRGKIIKGTGKIDIQDKNGKLHSVKGAQLKWQIFLYGRNRFLYDFEDMGDLFIKCIDSFPERREDYVANKDQYKFILSQNMVNLKTYLENKKNQTKFFIKSFLNNQIDYFVIYDNGIFHIFDAEEAMGILGLLTRAKNSKAKSKNQRDNQKVIFTYQNKTVGEIEMRNDSNVHYKQIKFWMEKKGMKNLLIENIPINKQRDGIVILYGRADDSFLK